jgi:glycosyltransferase involved in cell wall biosynthesis
MPFDELGAFYRAADIGVWPTDESTSTLDVAACGIPVIISDKIIYRKHIEGNGVTYKLNDVDDLVEKLLGLRDRQERERLGSFGAQKMASSFNWQSIAERRLADYKIAIGFNGETILKEEDER